MNDEMHEQVEAAQTPMQTSSPEFLTRAQKEELKALSKEVFGSSSRYQKLMNEGFSEMVTEEISEIVPGEDGKPDTERMVKVPVKRADGAMQFVQKYHTFESVLVYMKACKVTLDNFKVQMAQKAADEKAAKEQEETNKKVQEELSGSAV